MFPGSIQQNDRHHRLGRLRLIESIYASYPCKMPRALSDTLLHLLLRMIDIDSTSFQE